MKIIQKFFSVLLILIILMIVYLSTIGIETEKLNNNIKTKINEVNKELDIELNTVKLILNPFNLKLNIKTIGPKLINNGKKIELENIKSEISIKSLFINKFSIEKLEISSKTLEIRNLLFLYRSINQSPEIIFLEKILKLRGYVIANIKLEFDLDGNLKDNFTAKGFVKDTKFNLTNDYKINNLNLLFDISKNNLVLNDIKFKINDLDFSSKSISAINVQNQYFIKGNIDNEDIELNNKVISLLKEKFFSKLDIQEINFSSTNNFSMTVDQKFKLKDFEINSILQINKAKILNKYNLKDSLPEIKDQISLINNKIELVYKKNNLKIKGDGDILLQKENDFISYNFEKNRKKTTFKTEISIKKNPLFFNFLNYKKNEKAETIIKINGHSEKKKKIIFSLVSLDEGKNKMKFENISFDNKNKFYSLDKIDLNYLDKDNQKCLIEILNENKDYILKGNYFNAENLIKNILIGNNENDYFKKNFNLKLNINKVRLDDEFVLNDLSGKLNFENSNLIDASLEGNFQNNKKMNFTVKSQDENKITTFFIGYAKPIVQHYKFIKGFDEGVLDFYSAKIGDQSNSTLKIYDFKLKELPTLTKLLTLASLQGIADILSGEGIRFSEFEMNFKNKRNLMTIDEIYAIGPAISILMDGYIEKDKLISLRGTLVPATTINKVIGSIPLLGKILVGSKTGEGVFGVSFKIKGPPKKLETTVNPIKTLTPRFITRTLEKIKKTN
jgi:hypothetical protein